MTIAIESPEKQNVETTCDEILDTRYRRCCQAMWYSKTMQNRVRLQIAAVRISISDVMKEEQRECIGKRADYRVPNDVRWYIEK